MNRFGGGGTIDDSEAQQLHDRFVSTNPDDRAFDNQTYNQSATEYLGKLPDDQFQDAARNAYNQAAPQDRQGLLGGLLGALAGGASQGDVANKLGLDIPKVDYSAPSAPAQQQSAVDFALDYLKNDAKWRDFIPE